MEVNEVQQVVSGPGRVSTCVTDRLRLIIGAMHSDWPASSPRVLVSPLIYFGSDCEWMDREREALNRSSL